MELHLVVPASPGDSDNGPTETLNGKLWRLIGPLEIKKIHSIKYHCISYVWGHGREEVGKLFNAQLRVSDQTRPALEAAMKAVAAAHDESKGPLVEAFWVDA